MFSSTAATREKAAREAGPGQADLSTGEFTHYFRGPFNGERAQETPDVSSSQPRPPAKPAGEFTEIFGRSKEGDSSTGGAPPKRKEASSAAPDSGGFTELFAVEKPLKAPGAEDLSRSKPPSPSTGGQFPGEKEAVPSFTPSPLPFRRPDSLSLTPPPSETNPPGLRPVEPRFSSGVEAEGSTPSFQCLKRSPCPIYRICRLVPANTRGSSPADRKASLPQANRQLPADQNSHQWVAPGFDFPPPRRLLFRRLRPSRNSPMLPLILRCRPRLVAPPPVPAAPQLGAAKPAQVPWALILTLNGLLILAELLVVYFVLKH